MSEQKHAVPMIPGSVPTDCIALPRDVSCFHGEQLGEGFLHLQQHHFPALVFIVFPAVARSTSGQVSLGMLEKDKKHGHSTGEAARSITSADRGGNQRKRAV